MVLGVDSQSVTYFFQFYYFGSPMLFRDFFDTFVIEVFGICIEVRFASL